MTRAPAIAAPARVGARDATTDDAPRIAALIGGWAQRGLTLARSLDDVLASIDEFVVVEHHGMVMACAAMEPFAPGLGEVRSVAVDPDATGLGIGAAAVRGLVDRASGLGIDRLLLMTRTPDFFVAQGFVPLAEAGAPPEYLAGQVAHKGRATSGRCIMSRPVESLVPAG